VIAAPPRILGELRTELSPEAAAVTFEVPKDLTHRPINEIEALLRAA
jgi:protein required for attachment to host cells